MNKLLIAISLLCLTACGKKVTADDVQITVIPNFINADPTGKTETVSISSSTAWKTTQTATWFTLSATSGTAGKTDITVSIPTNTSSGDRTGEISVIAGSQTKKISITQSKKLGFKIPAMNFSIQQQGGLIDVTSSGNKKYDINIPQGTEWITDQSSGDNMQFSIGLNDSGEDRVATITFTERGTGAEEKTLLIQTTNMPNGKLLNLKELKIDGIPALFGEYDGKKEFFYPVDIDIISQPKSHKIEFEGVGVEYVTFEGDNDTKVYSGDTYTFNEYAPNMRIRMTSYNTMIPDRKGDPRLNITGLPLVSITAPYGIVDEPKQPCSIFIIDPKGRTEDNLYYYESAAAIEYRGSGAQQYPKKPFSFELKDPATNADVDAKLLGLRNDQKWILDAMWLDMGRMRNRVCFDTWNEFNELYYKQTDEPDAKSGTHGHLVEVFLDGKYHGLFTLSDRLDRKQLKLQKEGGYLYKTRDWTNECILWGPPTSYGSYDNRYEYWGMVSIEHPTTPAPSGTSGGPGYIEFKYYNDLIKFVATSSPEQFAAEFANRIDINNTVDYFLFINLIMAYDNIGRNMYWGIYDVAKSTVMFPLVWDMDGTLGRTWDQFQEDPASGLLIANRHDGRDFKLFSRMLNENPANIKDKIKSRWTQLRASVLTPENLNAKVDMYVRQQTLSGAGVRESKRWPESKYLSGYTEGQYIKEWYSKRLTKMDFLINTL